MSGINIKRAVQNIGGKIDPYAALVELIVNAVQAIEEADRPDGCITVRVLRSNQTEMNQSLPNVEGFEVKDNGVGFTDEHLNSFDTLYTEQKIHQGGKGFGRFVCLKHFKSFSVKSVYKNENDFFYRNFSMGGGHDIVSNLEHDSSEHRDTGSIIRICHPRGKTISDKKLETIAKVIVQRILPFFVLEGANPPRIILREDCSMGQDGIEPICLNDFSENKLEKFIEKLPVDPSSFSLSGQIGEEKFEAEFSVYIFKLYTPRSGTNWISFVAHKREVSSTPLSDHIPEFEEALYEDGDENRRFIVKAYVCSDYLDANVSVERGGFKFKKHPEIEYPIGRISIEAEVSKIAENAVGSNIQTKRDKKRERIQSYVDNKAPWYKSILAKSDISRLPYNPTEEQMESHLHVDKFRRDTDLKDKIDSVLSSADLDPEDSGLTDIVNGLSDSSKEKLAEYVVFRKKILDLFGKRLEKCEEGNYPHESIVHDTIFRRKRDTETISYEDHNLWLIDERLNFTSHVASDKPLGRGNQKRPDILIFDLPHMFREDNVESNPITIFEFKRPQYDRFADASSQEDPILKILHYTNDIRAGKYQTPKGRPIEITKNTPAYGFVVCDINQKVEKWLHEIKNFKVMPDKLGWFQWYDNNNLFVQVIKWDKILRDAEIRNKIFFEKLGLK